MAATSDGPPLLVVGNKAYSSWSLRGWLALRLAGIAFTEHVIPLDRPETAAEIARYSPTGRVPALVGPGLHVWDSLAIACWALDRAPGAGLLPADPEARAWSWSIIAEMHSGFEALRRALPMDLKRRPAPRGTEATAEADIRRIREIWDGTLARFGGVGGPFLFGPPTLADAVFAPVVVRFTAYAVPLDRRLAAYAAAVRAWPPMAEWSAAAVEEPWVIEKP